jgi:magnesium chelatase subunit D
MLGGVASVVVDCESGPVRLGLAASLAGTLGAALIRLDEVPAAGRGRSSAAGVTAGRAPGLAGAVRAARAGSARGRRA